MAKGDSGRELSGNLRQSVGAARGLTFALGQMGGKLGQAAKLAETLAQNISKAAGASKALTSSITFGVAAVASIVAGVLSWKSGTKDLKEQIAAVRREIEITNTLTRGDKRAAAILQIKDALAKELAQAKENESFLRKRLSPELYDDLIASIKAKAAAEIVAVGKAFSTAFAAAQAMDFSTIAQNKLAGGTDADRAHFAAGEARRRSINEAEEQFFGEDLRLRMERIEEVFRSEVERIEVDRIQPLGQQLGRGFAGAIADGISAGIREGDLGAGFRALTGGLLVALGQMMQELGTKALLASTLWTSIVALFGTPAGIGAALAMIAAGAAVAALGQSLGGGGVGRSSAASGNVYGTGQTVINRGLVNPGNTTSSVAGLSARSMIVLAPTIFGTRDADAQRGFLEMYDLAMARR